LFLLLYFHNTLLLCMDCVAKSMPSPHPLWDLRPDTKGSNDPA
jgi:hypothetical protein